MKTELTKLFTQFDARGFEQSELLIKVEADIDRSERTAAFSQLIYIKAYDCKTGTYTDITNIMFNHFHDQAEVMIESIDWWEVYKDNKIIAA